MYCAGQCPRIVVEKDRRRPFIDKNDNKYLTQSYISMLKTTGIFICS